MTEHELSCWRNLWQSALESDMSVQEMASKISWGLSETALQSLCALHKADICREKIEALLTECNFHVECTMWHKGEYDSVPLF